jgi:hypothetical protein
VYENEVHQGLMAADALVDEILTVEQREEVQGWRGQRIAFGRMHLRLVLRGRPNVAKN